MNNLVSVIIPTYNGASTIRRCLNSVINQTYSNIEIIVVIDKATNDSTEEILKNINSDRIKYYVSDKEKSASYNRNLGINKSKGEYISFIDDDDEWEKNKIEKQVDFLKNNKKYKSVITNYTFILGNSKKRFRTFSSNYTKEVLLMSKKLAAGSNIMTSRDELFSIGLFDDTFQGHQDLELVIKLDSKHKIGHIDEYLVNIYGRSGRVLTNAQKIADIKTKFLEKFSKIISSYPKKVQKEIYARHWLQVSRAYALEDNIITSIKYLKLSISYKILFSPVFKIIPFETYYLIAARYLINMFKPNK